MPTNYLNCRAVSSYPSMSRGVGWPVSLWSRLVLIPEPDLTVPYLKRPFRARTFHQITLLRSDPNAPWGVLFLGTQE
jgi:hypothetical protein